RQDAHLRTSDLACNSLGDEIVHLAKQRIVDSIGCAFGAVDSDPVNAIGSYLDTLAPGPSTVFFSRRMVGPDLAAFINATMVRYLDYNDGYFALEPAHSSDNIPAILAVAQAEGLGGRDVIVSMAIAYEMQMRFRPSTPESLWCRFYLRGIRLGAAVPSHAR
ncbi:MmgE/PrpD family protein, partial [Bradyrhizobium sp. 1]|nr:MmgE/PrpD family protein [Bradyrhizobium sp. 1]